MYFTKRDKRILWIIVIVVIIISFMQVPGTKKNLTDTEKQQILDKTTTQEWNELYNKD